MSTFNTIHIFGYGETQLIKNNYNKKIKSSLLSKLQPVIADVITKSGKSVITPNSYHSINIFSNLRVTYNSKVNKDESFNINFADLNATKLAALITEVETKVAEIEAAEAASQQNQ